MKIKQLLGIILTVALLLTCLAGCGSTASESSTEASAAAESTEESAAAPETAEETAEQEPTAEEPAAAEASAVEASVVEESVEAEPQVGVPDLEVAAADLVTYTEEGYELPMFADTLKITYWMPVEHDLANLVNNYDDMESYQWIEENLNVDIEWTQCSTDAKSDSFNLMCAGGDYCDLIDGVFDLYSGGDDAAIEDEVIIALDDYIYDYMPFYTSYFANEDIRKAVMTDLGQFGSVYQMRGDLAESLTNGPVVRLDWLEECGFDYDKDNLPTTLDEWHEILTAFHNKYGAVTLWDSTGVQLIGTWGTYAQMPGGQGPQASNLADGFYYDNDGNIVFGPTSDAFRTYIEDVAAWYAEGLIDPDFITASSRTYETEMFSSNKTGLWAASNLQDIINNVENIEDILTAIPYPVKDENSYVYGGYSSYAMQNATAISTACENVEECLLFLDWFYTPEGSMLATYGMEGITYEYTDDGSIELTDFVVNNPDGLSDKVTICLYSTFGSYLYESSYDNVGLTELKQTFYDIWKTNWSPVTSVIENEAFLSDEASEQTGILAEIGTYGGTVFLEWIIGTRELNDDTWNEYVETCNELGADRALELEQIAVERYSER